MTREKNLRIMYLSGAGGVGKTATANAMVALAQDPNLDLHVTYVGSPNRWTLLGLGFADERSVITQTAEERKVTQGHLRRGYLRNLEASIADFYASAGSRSQHNQLLLVDRSPFDSVAYALVDAPDLTLTEIEELVATATQYIAYPVKSTVLPLVVLFDYPTSWATAGQEVHDGFRVSTELPARNFVWAKTLEHLTRKCKTANLLTVPSENAESPAKRAAYLLTTCMES